MENKCLLSIITVNLNNLEGLKRTIQSVFTQTWQEFEYIVIDGGSNDGSKEYMLSYDEKIDFWVSEPDKGIYNAMNKGIKKANGEYLFFLNSGDHFSSKESLNRIKDDICSFDLIYFNIDLIKDNLRKSITYPSRLNFSYFITGTLCHQSTLIRKELFSIVGKYDEELKIVSDWKFLVLALFKYNCSYQKVNHTLSTFYLDGISSDPKNLKKLNKEKEAVLIDHFRAFLPEIKELNQVKKTLQDLRNSRKINFLVRLGLLKKF
ncbi:glycosyltransferase [Salinimicrobium sp. CDJ15-81-2]|nr:glycosyltransferase [Salinimicrobium nanhaiense]